jgi:hypothetical protein
VKRRSNARVKPFCAHIRLPHFSIRTRCVSLGRLELLELLELGTVHTPSAPGLLRAP